MKELASITVQNAQRTRRVKLNPLRQFAERALRLCLAIDPSRQSELRALQEVAVVLVSDRRMAALHKKFMNLRGATDVLTFQHGEIFVSVETAARNARRFHSSTENEIRLYLVHGLLHLHGFDDTTAVKARLMASRQKKIFSAAQSTSDRRTV